MAQKDSISRIYCGITIVPIAPVYHTVEDAEWYVTRYSPGGAKYEELAKRTFREDYNIAVGAILFISFNNYFNISFGVLRDLMPYKYQRYLDGIGTENKFYYYRYPINIRFSIFQSKRMQFFLQTGIQIRNDRIYEGLGSLGLGLTYPINNKFSLSSNLDFSLHKELISGVSKTFPSFKGAISCSYKIPI